MRMVKIINLVTNTFLHRQLAFDENIPTDYLLGICLERVCMLLRGFFCFGLNKKSGRLMIGKYVQIKCKSMLNIGYCVSIQDEVVINALSKEGIFLGNNVSIGQRSMIKASGSLAALGKGFFMGHDSTMGNDCFVGAAGGIRIGNYVVIGQNVRFHSENHEFHDRNKMICEQGVTNKGILIGDDCWIGAGAVILDGVHIGKGCVIGANTLVNKNIPEYSIAVGNPVRVIGKRK